MSSLPWPIERNDSHIIASMRAVPSHCPSSWNAMENHEPLKMNECNLKNWEIQVRFNEITLKKGKLEEKVVRKFHQLTTPKSSFSQYFLNFWFGSPSCYSPKSIIKWLFNHFSLLSESETKTKDEGLDPRHNNSSPKFSYIMWILFEKKKRKRKEKRI